MVNSVSSFGDEIHERSLVVVVVVVVFIISGVVVIVVVMFIISGVVIVVVVGDIRESSASEQEAQERLSM